MFIIDKNFQHQQNIEIYEFNPEKKLFKIIDGELKILHFQFDSRKINQNEYFIALKGERDGHEFILDAIDKGSDGIIVEKSKKDLVFDKILMFNVLKKIHIIFTENTYEFLYHSAIYQRKRFNGKVIAILGSNGKTSTKDFLFQALNVIEEYTFATIGNWNNHIGVPMILLNMPEKTKILILELGMNHPGEIFTLGEIAKPDIAVITSIGREHMEFFSSVEEVAKAELEIIHHLSENHTIYYPLNAPLKEYLKEISLKRGFKVILFELTENHVREKNQNVINGTLYEHTIYWNGYKIKNSFLKHIGLYSNLFLTLVILHNHFFQALEKETIQKVLYTLSNLKPNVKQRFEIHNINDITIIDDSYNANPDSFIAAIESIKKLFPKNIKPACIAGHMAELGEYSEIGHFLVGESLANNDIDLISVCGNLDVLAMIKGYKTIKTNVNIPYYENSEVLARNLHELILPIKHNVILIKGSRSANMEKITKKLLEVLKHV